MDRRTVLSEAINSCMKELYSLAQPSVTWDEFVQENAEFNIKYKEWDDWKMKKTSHPEWEDKSITECIGPKPFEFYYLPKDILEDICNSYINAYQLDSQQELLNIIQILKNYCKEPIISKYIEGENGEPGYKGYEHPDNLEKEINTYLDLKFPLMDPERAEDAEDFENKLSIAAKELQDKFFEFLDMAGKFYNWNGDLNTFNINVYLGASPNSNKEAVIENWKKYRNKDIEIDDSVYKNENDDDYE